ncbi:hypothetical protein [Embleya sp. NPDC001921]
MDTDEQEGARLLGALRGTPWTGAEEPGVDIARAIRDGRRTIRVRRALTVAGGAIAVALVVLMTVLVVAPTHDNGTGPASGGAFDVRERAFRVGSAGGFTPVSYETGKFRQRVVLGVEKPNGPTELSATRAMVTMYAPGRLPGGEPPLGTPAPPVNGHAAVWSAGPEPSAGRVELVWQWAPNAWAVATLAGPAADAERVHHVAEGVAPGVRQPARVPVSLDQAVLAAGEHVIAVVAPMGKTTGSPRYSLRYGTVDPPGADGTEPPWFEVGVGDRPPGVDRQQLEQVTRSDGAFVEFDAAVDQDRSASILAAVRVGEIPSTGPTGPTRTPPSPTYSEPPSDAPSSLEATETAGSKSGTATMSAGTGTSTSPTSTTSASSSTAPASTATSNWPTTPASSWAP